MMRGRNLLVALMFCAGQSQAAEPRFNAVGVSFDASVDTPGSLLGAYRPQGFSAGAWSAGTYIGLGDGVLDSATQNGDVTAVIDEVVSLVAVGNYDLSERVRVHASAPLHTVLRSEDGREGSRVGDVRLATHVVVVPRMQDAYDLSFGVVPFIDIPAGGATNMVGEGSLGGGLKLTATGEIAGFHPTVNVGYHGVAGGNATVSAGSRLTSAVGVAWHSGAFGVSTEAHKQFRLGSSDVLGPGAAEWISSGSWRSNRGLQWVGGGAVGLANGVGVPAYRVFVGVRTSMGGQRPADAVPTLVVQSPAVEAPEPPAMPVLANQHPEGVREAPAMLPVWAVPRNP